MEFSRDPCRSPMQWTSSIQSGFTMSSKPWLPVHDNYRTVNVEVNLYFRLSNIYSLQFILRPDSKIKFNCNIYGPDNT